MDYFCISSKSKKTLEYFERYTCYGEPDTHDSSSENSDTDNENLHQNTDKRIRKRIQNTDKHVTSTDKLYYSTKIHQHDKVSCSRKADEVLYDDVRHQTKAPAVQHGTIPGGTRSRPNMQGYAYTHVDTDSCKTLDRRTDRHRQTDVENRNRLNNKHVQFEMLDKIGRSQYHRNYRNFTENNGDKIEHGSQNTFRNTEQNGGFCGNTNADIIPKDNIHKSRNQHNKLRHNSDSTFMENSGDYKQNMPKNGQLRHYHNYGSKKSGDTSKCRNETSRHGNTLETKTSVSINSQTARINQRKYSPQKTGVKNHKKLRQVRFNDKPVEIMDVDYKQGKGLHSDTVYMIESAHDSSSGIASDDQAGPNSSSSYLEGAPSSKASSGYAETSTGFRYYDIDDDDDEQFDADDEDFGFNRSNARTLKVHTAAQIHGHWPRGMTQTNHQQVSNFTQQQMGYGYDYNQTNAAHNKKNLTKQPKSNRIAQDAVFSQNNTESDIYRDYRAYKEYSKENFSYFDILPDNVITKIFSCLTSDQLCKNALVSRRFYDIVWQPLLWKTIWISDAKIDVDTALKVLTKRLSYETPHVCLMVESITLSGCLKLTDRGLYNMAKRCLELRQVDISNCPEVTNIALFELVSRCVNLEMLNVSGCPSVTCICLTPEATLQAAAYGKQLLSLRHLDMTDCVYLDDSGLQILASYCSQLVYLYLRRCYKVSDIGVQYVANYCTSLKELSLCDCRNVTDFGMREIAKLGRQLRYLSVAKCDKISDVGVKYVAQYCRRMRYLNVRGCPAVSDDSLDVLAQCCRRLKSLDIGKCDVTDEGLQSLAENSPQLRRLSLKSCDAITDQGILSLAYNCPHLQQLNIQDCHLSVEAYRAVKRNCKRCIIEHTNPGFY